ncbi:MAG: DUF4157 domain-containing protein [Verrucomicrobia bacterium]|nr:DUF4157 domain-containing protein [Verrucomicrobiota bacterium]
MQSPQQAPRETSPSVRSIGLLQRKCACGGTPGLTGECEEYRKKRESMLQRRATGAEPDEVPTIVHEVLRSPGQPLDPKTCAFMEPRFGHDFNDVRVHTDVHAGESARAVHALAYTVGPNVVFGKGQYAPDTSGGQRLLAHELTHVLQQGVAACVAGEFRCASECSPAEQQAAANAEAVLDGGLTGPLKRTTPMLQRRSAPYIKRITVHLTPLQSADLEWEGTPPVEATGSNHFTVSTGKGYSDPGDPRGTCTRSCCRDPMKQCAPPWNQPTRVGACCTYYGSSFWTGTPEPEHGGPGGWKFWTPIQPYYARRGIALHQHTEVTGQPIGHGCVRMEEANARRIAEFSNGRRTNVTIEGRAAPVLCEPDRRCGGVPGGGASGA